MNLGKLCVSPCMKSTVGVPGCGLGRRERKYLQCFVCAKTAGKTAHLLFHEHYRGESGSILRATKATVLSCDPCYVYAFADEM